MTTSYEDAYNRVLKNAAAHLPGALPANLRVELFNTLDEFFQQTNAWVDTDTLHILPAQREYYIVPQYGRVVRFAGLWAADDHPIRATMPVIGTVRLSYVPSEAFDATAYTILTVSDPLREDDLPQVPIWIFTTYSNTIVSGILHRMMIQPAKPYSNPNLSTLHGRRFHSGMVAARADADKGFVQNAQPWRFPFFA